MLSALKCEKVLGVTLRLDCRTGVRKSWLGMAGTSPQPPYRRKSVCWPFLSPEGVMMELQQSPTS
ncbi:hypothetical protein DPMN_093847 [Dreissena polymorpha]|uniref:Uncharacterized protein n=1 Tax=Dreissena polymorpha TaxID=45954 RepID=A0A9D4KYN7_DREPO|nr:hypothetical protein DPMN_090695 [Dreissena polymorpha]KAH3851367.1 hypothetical protein DPMN_093847 [Dreissena polymorpha]